MRPAEPGGGTTDAAYPEDAPYRVARRDASPPKIHPIEVGRGTARSAAAHRAGNECEASAVRPASLSAAAVRSAPASLSAAAA